MKKSLKDVSSASQGLVLFSRRGKPFRSGNISIRYDKCKVQISNFDDLHEEDEKGQKSQLCPIILSTFSSHRRRHIFTGLLFINVNPNLSIVYLLFHDTCMLISPSTHTLSRLSFRSSRSKVQPKPTPVILPVILQGNIICPNEEG